MSLVPVADNRRLIPSDLKWLFGGIGAAFTRPWDWYQDKAWRLRYYGTNDVAEWSQENLWRALASIVLIGVLVVGLHWTLGVGGTRDMERPVAYGVAGLAVLLIALRWIGAAVTRVGLWLVVLLGPPVLLAWHLVLVALRVVTLPFALVLDLLSGGYQAGPPGQETFVAAEIRDFCEGAKTAFRNVLQWRDDLLQRIEWWIDDVEDWFKDHQWHLVASGVIVLGVAWFALRTADAALRTVVFGYAVTLGPLLGLLFLNASWLLQPIVSGLLFLPLLVGPPVHIVLEFVVVLFKLLALVPLFFLFVTTRLSQLIKGIFHTCPNRACTLQERGVGLPLHLCPACKEPNANLWPNLYGLLWHPCATPGCPQRLPTLGFMGRSKLQRKCRNPNCNTILTTRSGVEARERHVAITGGTFSGKTCYLAKTIEAINTGRVGRKYRLKGDIEDEDKARWHAADARSLRDGVTFQASATETAKAYRLLIRMGRARYQLYLYDAPGEEFRSTDVLSDKQKQFSHIEGFILMVDPLSIDEVRHQHPEALPKPKETPAAEAAPRAKGRKGKKEKPPADQTMADKGQPPEIQTMADIAIPVTNWSQGAGVARKNGKLALRAAVVISKADLEAVVERIGDIRRGPIAGDTCRHALMAWGCHNAIKTVQQTYSQVQYFACSPLGRSIRPR